MTSPSAVPLRDWLLDPQPIMALARAEVLEERRCLPLAASEILLTSQILPILVALGDDGAELVGVAAPSLLRSPLFAPSGAWLPPYQPISLRTLGFSLRMPTTGDMLDDLLICPEMRAAEGTGSPTQGEDGQPSAILRVAHRLLASLESDQPRAREIAEALLVAGLAEPMAADAQERLRAAGATTRFFSVTGRRLEESRAWTLERLARSNFAAVETACAAAMSRRFLHASLKLTDPGPQPSPQAKAPADAAFAAVGGFAFDDSELFPLP